MTATADSPIPNNTPAGSVVSDACSAAFAEVAAEIARAMAKFPTWPYDALHALAVVAEEMGELQKEVLQMHYEPHKTSSEAIRTEAVQLAAMSIRFLMSLDRYRYYTLPQHSQNTKLSDAPRSE